MKRILVFCVLAVAIVACNKDKVESTPHLKFKSVSSDHFNDTVSQGLSVILEFTDQEGDLDSVFMTRLRANRNAPSPNYVDVPLKDLVPEFGNQNRGELQLNFDLKQDIMFGNFGSIDIPNTTPRRYETDTVLLRFYVKDKAGHTSDTAAVKPIYISRHS
ncbi:MAG TPA: hypothetical protein VNT20_09260 [Flavisolibacter sp.]|jgi:hypothetical protein|nr:hypothetical protein [Flavisolibacter sp.]